MPNIYIKTRMRKMPHRLCSSKYYGNGNYLINLTATYGAGNEPNREQMDGIMRSLKAAWCPLVEMEGSKQ